MGKGMRIFSMIFLIIIFLTSIGYCEKTKRSEIPGMFSISTDPPGAEIILQNFSLGTTPLLYIPSSDLKVPFIFEIIKPGYYSEVRNITELPQSGNIITISISLKPSPQFGRITILAKPDGSLVSLDGDKPVEVPYTYDKVPVGNHSIIVSKSGYKTYKNSQIFVNADKDIVLQVFLISNTEKKVLVVMTSPPDAEILVDGIYRGTTLDSIPLKIGPLIDGKHIVKTRLTGYKDVVTEVVTQEFISTNLDLILEPINAIPKSASLKVRTNPYGADVMLSGIWAGQTPILGYLEVKNIPSNRYYLTISLLGYENVSEWIEPKEGENIIIERTLKSIK